MLVPVERQQKVDHARRAAAELGKVALKEAATTHRSLVHVSYMYVTCTSTESYFLVWLYLTLV